MGDFNTRIRKTSRSAQPIDEQGRRRFEHRRIDNQVYFITSSVRDHQRAFAGDEAKGIFWDRFVHHTTAHGFTPWATSLLDSHYHTVGYLRRGEDLPKLMQKLHGSVAKLVNDLLDERLAPFWRDPRGKGRECFDGCLRDELQARRAYRYTLRQPVRAGLVRDWRDYPHVRVNVELERAVRRAHELGAFLEGVPY